MQLNKPYALIPAAFAIVLAAFCLTSLQQLLNDADTGWHIYAGKYIVETGAVSTVEPFSFTAGSLPWLNISWLWDLTAYFFDSIGGLYSVAVYTAVFSAAIIGVIAYGCLKNGSGVIVTMLALMAGSIALFPGLIARPHIVTYIFAPLFIIILNNIREDGRKISQICWLPLLMLVWANIHGGFFAGITIIGAYWLQSIFTDNFRHIRQYSLCGIICLAATFVNPLGPDVYEAARRTMEGELKNYVSEWFAPNRVVDFIYPAIFLFALVKGFRRHRLADILISLFWLVQAMVSARHLPLFYVVSVFFTAENLRIWLSRYKNYTKKEAEYEQDFSSRSALKYLSISAAFFLLIAISPLPKALLYPNGFQPDTKTYPYEEIAFIRKNYPNERYFNFYDYGGYIIYGTNGTVKTFIDGRAETAFPSKVVEDYVAVIKKPEKFVSVSNKYNITAAILPVEYSKHRKLILSQPEWKEVFRGSKAIVYVRTQQAYEMR